VNVSVEGLGGFLFQLRGDATNRKEVQKEEEYARRNATAETDAFYRAPPNGTTGFARYHHGKSL
jgi:hypothetical protein